MSSDVPIGTNDSAGRDNYKLEKTSFDPKSPYRCHLAISRDEDGSVSVVVLNLPGAGSCGKTEEEAIANAREAIQGVIESYLEDGRNSLARSGRLLGSALCFAEVDLGECLRSRGLPESRR